MPQEQGFNQRRREFAKKELSANMYGRRKVDHIGIFSAFLLNDYGLGNQFIEVVHSEAGKDFLVDKLRLFCMKKLKTHGILQIAERGFNAPAHGVKLFNSSAGKQSASRLVRTVSEVVSVTGNRTRWKESG